uniref:Uncharacterized protein n=1 Tax=Arundo donax TaxID=35708 RepID=A0A0A9FT49_ARUDO
MWIRMRLSRQACDLFPIRWFYQCGVFLQCW